MLNMNMEFMIKNTVNWIYTWQTLIGAFIGSFIPIMFTIVTRWIKKKKRIQKQFSIPRTLYCTNNK